MWFTNPMAEICFVDSDGEKKRTWVQLLRPGKWKHSEYGTLKFDDKFFDSMIRNFDNNVRKIELAIDTEHKPDEGAAGWIKKLENRGEKGLWALIEWTSKGTEYLKDKIYRYLSAEFDHSWKDEETGRKYKNVLFGAALTNRPFIKGMEPVNLSEYKKELREDDEIKRLLSFAEKVNSALNDGDITMKKKCKHCNEVKELDEQGFCSMCLEEHDDDEKKKKDDEKKKKEQEAKEKLAEAGEPAKINQTPTGGGGKSDDERDQAKKREEAEKRKNKGNVVAKGPKSVKQTEGKDGVVVFEDEDGNLYVLDEDKDDDEDDDEKKNKKKKEKKDDEIELSEDVMIATKKFSEREKATLTALSEASGKTRKVLSENLKVLREGRVENEKRNIKEMLSEHFMDGKLTPNEKDMWEEILCNETPQTDVAVFKLSEGEEDKKEAHFRPLVYIVDSMLTERPAVVELKEIARSDKEGTRLSEEQRDTDEATVVAKRVGARINAPDVTRRKLSEEENK